MFRYLLKRILFFIPTLLVISLLSFGLSKLAPGDPLDNNDEGKDVRNQERVDRETAAFWGLDKPVFYFSLSSAAYPDTLYRILQADRREALEKLVAQYGNWDAIASYYNQIQNLERFLYYELPENALFQEISIVRSNVRELYIKYRDNEITALLENIKTGIKNDSLLQILADSRFQDLKGSYHFIKQNPTRSQLYIPDFKWYGFDNQYHNWFTKFLRGDFGVAYRDGRPVADKISDALLWTLVINGISILIAYLLSIPLGIFSAVRKDTFWDRIVTVFLFALHSLPVFWIATLLLIFFTTPEYGMYLFPNPASGMGKLSSTAPFWNRFAESLPRLILPVFCITYGSLAFISRQMRGGMLDVLQQDYIRTARAKGLGERKVIWKHAFRNALFPIITLFASVFPAALAGSVVIEAIYNIPGMGKLTLDAITARDWPIVYTVLMLSAILTMIGILIADILYALLDPRVRFK